MEDKYVITSWFYENGERKHERILLSLSEWNQQQEKHPLWNKFKDNLGISGGSQWYFELAEGQDFMKEFNNINNFLDEYLNIYAKKNNIKKEDLSLQFINYGRTQLVYVLTEPSGKKVTVLVKQPAVTFGQVRQEANILSELKDRDPHVIAPIDYYSSNNQELYVTPYLHQARCIASDKFDGWGVYVPEPIYRFDSFTHKQADTVNTCMIAKLVSLFDQKKSEGISACKLGGGDFILAKGWENKKPSTDWILDNMYLIAARDTIKCSFDDYLDTIRSEFSRQTIDEDQNSLKLNIRGRCPMSVYQIEKGISLGKQMLQQHKSTFFTSEESSM